MLFGHLTQNRAFFRSLRSHFPEFEAVLKARGLGTGSSGSSFYRNLLRLSRRTVSTSSSA